MAAIHSIVVIDNPVAREEYKVGVNNVTKIEEFPMAGLHCDIAHVRVYKNDQVHSEFCRHNIVGVYYEIEAV